jgi:hypothetical protein
MIQSVTLRNVRKSMNTKFDELTKSMAQSVSRRAALKEFGICLAGMALACFGLANKAKAGKAGPDFCASCMNNCLALGYSRNYCQKRCADVC